MPDHNRWQRAPDLRYALMEMPAMNFSVSEVDRLMSLRDANWSLADVDFIESLAEKHGLLTVKRGHRGDHARR